MKVIFIHRIFINAHTTTANIPGTILTGPSCEDIHNKSKFLVVDYISIHQSF